MKSIIIGNGINLRLNISQLSADQIVHRFIKNIRRYKDVLWRVFEFDYTEETEKALFFDKEITTIEILAGDLYRHIRRSTAKPRWTDNDEYRLQDVIASISVLSIFYDDKGKILPEVNADLLPDLEDYDNIFTLNYHEFWPVKKEIIYLHGKLNYDELPNEIDVFFYSPARYHLEEYKHAIDDMKIGGNAVALNPFECVFAPEGIAKNELFCIAGIYPSENLFLAKDLFPISPRKLYSEMDGMKEIEVFGVSPYGEDSLFNKISEADFARIYIYGKNKHTESACDEMETWNKKLKCSHEFVDSEKMR